MPSDFRAVIMAQLDDKSVAKEINDIGSKHKIVFNNISFDRTALSNAIQSALNGQNININLGNANFNTQNLSRQAEQIGNSIGRNLGQSATSQLNRVLISNNPQSIWKMQESLRGLGMSNSNIKSVTKDIENLWIAINKITTNIQPNGNLSLNIRGVDSFGNVVNVIRQYDKEANLVTTTNTKITQSFDANAKQIQINEAAITKYLTKLDEMQLKAINPNETKFISNIDSLDTLSTKYNHVRDTIESLRTADSQSAITIRANIESEINSFDGLIKTLRNAEYAASQLRAKPLETVKQDELNKLTEFLAIVNKSGISLDSFKTNVTGLQTMLKNVNDVPQLTQYLNALSNVKSEFKALRQEQSQFANATEVNIAINKMETWLRKNQKAAKIYGDEIRNLINRLKQMQAQGGVLPTELKNITNNFTEMKTAAAAAGLTGRTFFQQILGAAKSLGRYFGVSTLVYRTFGTIKNGIKDIVDLDTALVDLKKTTDGTEAQLNSFYYSANESAKKLGVTTKEIISASADWSRLGYSLKDAETMAQVSAKFEAISPNVDMQKAQDGLVSAMKAFNIEANDALDGIASKINAIGNSQSVSNGDIIEFLTRSSSAMKEANNTLEDTIKIVVIKPTLIYGETPEKDNALQLITGEQRLNVWGLKKYATV